MKFLIISSIIIFTISNTGCGKNCKEVHYQFSMQEIFSPERDSISVGDTLWVSASHSTTYKDLVSNAQINFSNSRIGFNIGILNFPDTSQSVIGAVYDFGIIKIYGEESGNDNIPTQNKGFYFAEKNGEYLFKFGFIPKRKGIYSISVGDDISVIRTNSGCEKSYITITNANLNNHLYYYQNFRPGYQISGYERTHMYCFKVK